MEIRQVVTGHDAQGKSVFVTDRAVTGFQPTLMPGAEFFQMWAADQPAIYPSDGLPPDADQYFPSVEGFRFSFFTLPPATAVTTGSIPLDMEAAVAEVEDHMPGLLAHMEPDEPGMHTTDTTDFEVVMAGEVILELDDGAQVVLRPGDTVVQNGTRHRWRNEGDVPATLAVFMVGAHRR